MLALDCMFATSAISQIRFSHLQPHSGAAKLCANSNQVTASAERESLLSSMLIFQGFGFPWSNVPSLNMSPADVGETGIASEISPFPHTARDGVPSVVTNSDTNISQDHNSYTHIDIRPRAGSSSSRFSFSSSQNEKTPARSFFHRSMHGSHGKIWS